MLFLNCAISKQLHAITAHIKTKATASDRKRLTPSLKTIGFPEPWAHPGSLDLSERPKISLQLGEPPS